MNIDFSKYSDALVPVIVQDAMNASVLMLGFMNAEALEATNASGRVTFFSRSKNRLWTKGETSGNYLDVVSISEDCDRDTVLILARPAGPVCHTGSISCFGDTAHSAGTISQLERVIEARRSAPDPDSYVSGLFARGLNAVAQKVGEEAVELVIAAKDEDTGAFRAEAADLLFHYLILLQAKGLRLDDVLSELESRRR